MMKIVHLAAADQPRVEKPTKKQQSKETAELLANALRNSRSAKRDAARILEIELSEIEKFK